MQKIWRLDQGEKVLLPCEMVCLQATIKLDWKQPDPFIVLKADSQGEEIIPEVVSTKALQRSHRGILVTTLWHMDAGSNVAGTSYLSNPSPTI